MLTGWRVADPEYSTTPEQMLSGEGSYLYGGRWNSPGTRVVYLGTSLAQAGMELLVHLGRADVLNSFHKLTVSFDGGLVTHIDLADLAEDWTEASMAPAVQEVGDNWVLEAESLILHVPSLAVRGEYNYLLNAGHADADKLVVGKITLFDYDARLLK